MRPVCWFIIFMILIWYFDFCKWTIAWKSNYVSFPKTLEVNVLGCLSARHLSILLFSFWSEWSMWQHEPLSPHFYDIICLTTTWVFKTKASSAVTFCASRTKKRVFTTDYPGLQNKKKKVAFLSVFSSIINFQFIAFRVPVFRALLWKYSVMIEIFPIVNSFSSCELIFL